MFWAARGHRPPVGSIPTMPPAGNLFNSLIIVANAVEFIIKKIQQKPMTDSGAGGIGPADLQKLAQRLHQAALDR